ncbi:MAG: ComEC/Rec2 family competence protein, partial [Candidatus Omnitrophota bacterium]
GGRPSVARAAIMITVFLIARILNREIDTYNIISLAGMLILLANPMQLFNAGFILSFVCVFSIIYLCPRIENFFKLEKFNKKGLLYLIRSLVLTLAVYIGVAPIIAYYFNIISPVTIIANLFVVPLAGLLICIGFTFVLLGLLPVSLAAIFGSTVWLVAFLLERLIFYLSKIPFAYFYIPDLPIWSIAGYYALIILATDRKRFRLSKGTVFIIILICINFCIWAPLLPAGGGSAFGGGKYPEQLKITFLHVGHGDAIFIQFPKGQTMLVDTGGKSAYMDKGKDVVMPYIWHEGKNAIDCMLITHGDTDHFGGASSIIKRTKVRHFLYNGIEKGEEGYARLIDLVKSRSIKTFSLKEGDRIEGFKDTQILVLNPSEEFLTGRYINTNDTSVVLKLIYKNVSFLLCADILEKGIKNIIPYGELLNSDIIKVPHHGSCVDGYKYTADSFFSLVNPDIAIVTASRKSLYATPAESTARLLSEKGASIYITHKDGAIIITTDGEDYNLTTTYSGKAI